MGRLSCTLLHHRPLRGNLIAVNPQNPAAAEMNPDEHELRRRYAEAVRLERIRANLTQAEFALLVGVRLLTVQRWEWAQSMPSAVLRRRLTAMYPRLRDVLGNNEGDD